MKRDRSSLEDQNEDSHKTNTYKKSNKLTNKDYTKLQTHLSDLRTINVLHKKGIKNLSPIQQRTFFDIYKGVDMIARDKTGSGKTLAFSIPAIERFRQRGYFQNMKGVIKMIIILPTRQLVVKVGQEILSLQHFKGQFSVRMVFGGNNFLQQRAQIQLGCDIIVGTPGRILDFLYSEIINPKKLSVLCLDEVDEMLKNNFKDSIDKIIKLIKRIVINPFQTLLFSATLPQQVLKLSKKYLSKDYKTVDIISEKKQTFPSTIKHFKIQCQKRSRVNIIKSLIQKFVKKEGKTIIFCQTKIDTVTLKQKLALLVKQPIQVLNGETIQQKRLQIFSAFKSGSLRFIVATNVLARGIDIHNVDLVIQYSPAKFCDDYIHRSGRAGKLGACVTLFSEDQCNLIVKIQRQTNLNLQFLTIQNISLQKQQNQQKQQKLIKEQIFLMKQKSFELFEELQNSKVESVSTCKFVIEGWRKSSATAMQLSEYIKSVIDVCAVKTSIQDNNNKKLDNLKVFFEVPVIHKQYVMKMNNQFKIDGYYVSKVDLQKEIQVQPNY